MQDHARRDPGSMESENRRRNLGPHLFGLVRNTLNRSRGNYSLSSSMSGAYDCIDHPSSSTVKNISSTSMQDYTNVAPQHNGLNGHSDHMDEEMLESSPVHRPKIYDSKTEFVEPGSQTSAGGNFVNGKSCLTDSDEGDNRIGEKVQKTSSDSDDYQFVDDNSECISDYNRQGAKPKSGPNDNLHNGIPKELNNHSKKNPTEQEPQAGEDYFNNLDAMQNGEMDYSFSALEKSGKTKSVENPYDTKHSLEPLDIDQDLDQCVQSVDMPKTPHIDVIYRRDEIDHVEEYKFASAAVGHKSDDELESESDTVIRNNHVALTKNSIPLCHKYDGEKFTDVILVSGGQIYDPAIDVSEQLVETEFAVKALETRKSEMACNHYLPHPGGETENETETPPLVNRTNKPKIQEENCQRNTDLPPVVDRTSKPRSRDVYDPVSLPQREPPPVPLSPKPVVSQPPPIPQRLNDSVVVVNPPPVPPRPQSQIDEESIFASFDDFKPLPSKSLSLPRNASPSMTSMDDAQGMKGIRRNKLSTFFQKKKRHSMFVDRPLPDIPDNMMEDMDGDRSALWRRRAATLAAERRRLPPPPPPPAAPPPLPKEPLRNGLTEKEVILKARGEFASSLRKISEFGWYWGPMSWDDAEMRLENTPDGSFLVRDSSDERHILSLSFRANCTTHHTRIEHQHGKFSFWSQPTSHGSASVVDFIEEAMRHSHSGSFLYFLRPRFPGLPPAPVQLLYPISRYQKERSLQHMCRFVIRKSIRLDHIDELPLPRRLREYIKKSHYYTPEALEP